MRSVLALGAYYRVKPLVPRRVQVAARRARAREIWRRLERNPLPPVENTPLGFGWPHQALACAMVTHDVELAIGQRNIPALVHIEDALGIRSCWNFVVRRYRVDTSLIADLRAAGHEIGLHGVYHDGREFASESQFRDRLATMRSAAASWQAVGFRSPSLLFERSLLETIDFLWDSSMPSWDPFQPKRGDCLSYVPFRLNDHCVELPVTLWQDFTLFEELRCENIDIWQRQIDFIYKIGGLINVIVHPDYLRTRARLELYRALLEHLRSKERLWITTPTEVANWTRSAASTT